jgi:hypothetical protein
MIGKVNVDELTGFSHNGELLSEAQELVAAEAELVVEACRTSTRSGIATLNIEAMVPIASGSVAGIGARAPSLSPCRCRFSMLAEVDPAADCWV